MANVIIVGLLLLICIFAVRSYRKKLSYGCCGAGGGPEKAVKVCDREPSHYPYQAELTIEGMTCKNCKTRVENAFHAEEGFWVQVDLQRGSALVRAKQPPEERMLCKLVSRAGYRVTAVNGEPPKRIV